MSPTSAGDSSEAGSKGRFNAVGTGAAVVSCALANALGDDYLRRTPVSVEMIVQSLQERRRVDRGPPTHV